MPRTRTTWTQEQAAQMAARSAATRAARAAQRKLNSKPATTIPIPGNGPDLDHARAAMCARIEAGCSARTAEILSRAIRNLTLELNGGRTRAKPKYVPWSPVPVQSYSVDTHSQTGVGSGKILNEPRTLAPKAVGGSEHCLKDYTAKSDACLARMASLWY